MEEWESVKCMMLDARDRWCEDGELNMKDEEGFRNVFLREEGLLITKPSWINAWLDPSYERVHHALYILSSSISHTIHDPVVLHAIVDALMRHLPLAWPSLLSFWSHAPHAFAMMSIRSFCTLPERWMNATLHTTIPRAMTLSPDVYFDTLCTHMASCLSNLPVSISTHILSLLCSRGHLEACAPLFEATGIDSVLAHLRPVVWERCMRHILYSLDLPMTLFSESLSRLPAATPLLLRAMITQGMSVDAALSLRQVLLDTLGKSVIRTHADQLIHIWSDTLFVQRSTDAEHHLVCALLQSLLQDLLDKGPLYAALEGWLESVSMLPMLLQGVQTHLESPNATFRVRGQQVAETWSRLLDPANPLTFDAPPPSPPSPPAEDPSPTPPATDASDDTWSFSVSEDAWSDVSELDEMDALGTREAYVPIYFRDAVEGLRATTDMDKVQGSLDAWKALLDQTTPSQVDELAGVAAKSLLHLYQAQCPIPDKPIVVYQALVDLGMASPRPVALVLTDAFYHRDHSTFVRFEVLRVIEAVAKGLSGYQPTFAESVIQDAVHTDSTHVFSPPKAGIVYKSKDGTKEKKSRTLSTKPPVPHKNDFHAVVGAYFLPLVHGGAGKSVGGNPQRTVLLKPTDAHSVSMVHGEDAALMSRFVATLGMMLMCAKHAPSKQAYVDVLMEVCLVLLQHPEAVVRRAVVYALLCIQSVSTHQPKHIANQVYTWLAARERSDPDEACRNLARLALESGHTNVL